MFAATRLIRDIQDTYKGPTGNPPSIPPSIHDDGKKWAVDITGQQVRSSLLHLSLDIAAVEQDPRGVPMASR